MSLLHTHSTRTVYFVLNFENHFCVDRRIKIPKTDGLYRVNILSQFQLFLIPVYTRF